MQVLLFARGARVVCLPVASVSDPVRELAPALLGGALPLGALLDGDAEPDRLTRLAAWGIR